MKNQIEESRIWINKKTKTMFADSLRNSNLGADAIKFEEEFETDDDFLTFFRHDCEHSVDRLVNSLVNRLGFTREAADILSVMIEEDIE